MNYSVIVPVFNSEKTISKCLKSLEKQTIKEKFEVIVVDDGSTDNTKKEVKKFKKVKYLYQKNKGPAAARNFGVRKAKGKIVVFIDSDCEADKNMLKELILPFKNKEIIGAQGSYKSKQTSLMAKFVQIEIESRYELMKKSKFIDFLSTYCCAYRKKDFKEARGFDESFPMASGEDTELSYKLSKKGKKLIFNLKAFCYHQHPTSLIEYLKKKFYRAYWRIPLYSKHKEKAIKDSYTPQTLKIQIFLFFLIIASIMIELIYSTMNLTLTAIILMLISFIPFFLFALKKDLNLALISPLILFLRSASFALGLFLGFINKKNN